MVSQSRVFKVVYDFIKLKFFVLANPKKVEQETADMVKLTNAALTATESVKTMFSKNAKLQETYHDLWNFIGKVRLPQPYCSVNLLKKIEIIFFYAFGYIFKRKLKK